MEFSKQDTGAGSHFLLQGGLPDPGTELRSPTLHADSLLSEPPGKPSKMPRVDEKHKLSGKRNTLHVSNSREE